MQIFETFTPKFPAQDAPFNPFHFDAIPCGNQDVGCLMKPAVVFAMLLTVLTTSGCVPLVIGAGGAIAADTIAEDQGTDLF